VENYGKEDKSLKDKFFLTLLDDQEWTAHARARHGDVHSMHEEETKLGGRSHVESDWS